MKKPETLQEAMDQITEMQKLATQSGFVSMYFSELKNHPTYVDAFNAVNDKYFEYFGKYKYSDYNSFRMIIRRYYKKK